MVDVMIICKKICFILPLDDSGNTQINHICLEIDPTILQKIINRLLNPKNATNNTKQILEQNYSDIYLTVRVFLFCFRRVLFAFI